MQEPAKQEPAEYSETDTTVSITIYDTVYTLVKELTGEQFLTLQNKSIKPVSNVPAEFQTDEPQFKIDPREYDLWNLFLRLVEPDLSFEQVKALKRRVYMPLSLLGARLDAEEARSINDFLLANSSRFQLSPSNLVPSYDSPPVISEVSEE